ncbi:MULTISPECIES: hemerythrin domain-containing protein [unclassified Roseateles]|uniref:hemerythrin domain-containing protein n=1 Tax=unclassified Roseateles TaxID=2626991 RepID=UPI0006FF8EAD|nr:MULTISPECIES: hemerythrin domain-containing protein [unclassified Roseateles]KQW46566.1 hemerythrin [Pelomonas sp. Root405]KRA73617.1 hemerythrin [Pelomonas sp. Root662]
MPTASTKTTTTSAKRSSTATKRTTARQQDAIAMLKEDHKKVSALFEDFEKARSANRKKQIVATICQELTVHAQLEEEIFYPAFKAALKDKELVPEATVEHASVKDLIAQVRDQEPGGEDYDAKVKVMGEFVKHHVKEEQNEMFAKAKKSKLDLVELGRQMAERKQQLLTAH